MLELHSVMVVVIFLSLLLKYLRFKKETKPRVKLNSFSLETAKTLGLMTDISHSWVAGLITLVFL